MKLNQCYWKQRKFKFKDVQVEMMKMSQMLSLFMIF